MPGLLGNESDYSYLIRNMRRNFIKRNGWRKVAHSKFFYQCIKTKKRKSSILWIKDESDVWLAEKSLIEQKFISDFTARFTSQRGRSRHSVSTNIPRLVTIEENNLLTSCVTPQEIKDVFFEWMLPKHRVLMNLVQVFGKNISPLLGMILWVAFWIFWEQKLLKEVN